MKKLALTLAMIGLGVSHSTAAVNAIKCAVSTDSLYRVTSAELATAFGRTQAEIEGFLANRQLVVLNRGLACAAQYTTSNLTFFGTAPTNRFAAKNVYVIQIGPGLEMAQFADSGATEQGVQTFQNSITYERGNYCVNNLILNDAEADPWMWAELVPTLSTLRTLTYTSPIPAAVTGVSMTVVMKGLGPHPLSPLIVTSNRLWFSINGTQVATGLHYGIESSNYVMSLAGKPFGTQPVVRISCSNGPTRIYVDKYILTFLQQYKAYSNELFCTAQTQATITVRGFNANDIEVFEVTDSYRPTRVVGAFVSGVAGDFRASFHPPVATGRYVAVASGLRRSVDSLIPDYASDLRNPTNACDFLAVAPTSLMAAAQALVDYRAAHGLSAKLVSVEDVYDEFNYGNTDPRALRSFFGHAYYNWARAPRYVLLVGGGSLDYKDFKITNNVSTCLIPSMPFADAFTQYPSDVRLVTFDCTNTPSMAIGRLPASDSATLQRMISKIQAYEVGGTWKSNAVAVADSQVDWQFEADSEGLIARSPGQTFNRLYVDQLGIPSVTDGIVSNLNKGVGLMTYVGHGDRPQIGIDQTQGPIFDYADATAMLTNQTKPCMVVSLTCLVNEFGSISDAIFGKALCSSTGGAVAVFGACGYAEAGSSDDIAGAMLSNLYWNGQARIGDSILFAQKHCIELTDTNVVAQYNLLGDPAMSVGNVNSARPGETAPTNLPSYSDWKAWAFPPALVDAGASADPAADVDGDGISNYDEYMAGTDPASVFSNLRVTRIQRDTQGRHLVTWPSSTSRKYALERSTTINGVYTQVGSDILATAPSNVATDSVPSAVTYFYRVKVK